jgi:hypothetical protein
VEPPEEDSTTGTVSGKPEAHIPEADLVSYIIRRGIILLALNKAEAEASDGFSSDSSVRFFKPVFSIIEAHLRLRLRIFNNIKCFSSESPPSPPPPMFEVLIPQCSQ